MAAPSLDYCSLIAADSAAFADAAEAGDRDAPVEHCPGWSLLDLARHLWARAVLLGRDRGPRTHQPGRRRGARRDSAPARRRTDRRTATQLPSGWSRYCAAPTRPRRLDLVDRAHRCASCIRHQVQEAAVHRWDAQHAAGAAEPIHSSWAPRRDRGVPDLLGRQHRRGPPRAPRRSARLSCSSHRRRWTTASGRSPTPRRAQSRAAAGVPAASRERHGRAARRPTCCCGSTSASSSPPTGPDAADAVTRFRALTSTD